MGFEAKYYRSEAKRQLHKEIEIMQAVDGVTLVAIVDEAHLLSKDMLEEIRFLLNFKMDSQSPNEFCLVHAKFLDLDTERANRALVLQPPPNGFFRKISEEAIYISI
jgi:type II secretory pathway predicted ATPase ExeA